MTCRDTTRLTVYCVLNGHQWVGIATMAKGVIFEVCTECGERRDPDEKSL